MDLCKLFNHWPDVWEGVDPVAQILEGMATVVVGVIAIFGEHQHNILVSLLAS
jgi:hypothetical protein